MGTCYRDDTGVDQDVIKAVQLYQEAMEAVNVDATRILGTFYRYGTGADQDVKMLCDCTMKQLR